MEQQVVRIERNLLFESLPYPLALAIFLVQIALGILLFATFQKYVPNELGESNAWGGYLLASYWGARFLMETPTGAISDRIERRLGILLGFALMLPAIALMAASDRPYLFIALAAQLGLATAFLWPAAYAISADLYPPERRGRVISFLNLAQLLGFGIGALTGAFLVETASYWQFVVAGAAVSTAFLAALLGIPNYRGGRLLARLPKVVRPPLRSVISGRVVALSAIIVSTSTALSMAVPAIRPYGEEQLDVSFARLTVALIPAILVGVLLYVPAGHLTDRFGRVRPFFAGEVIVAAGLLLVAETRSLPLAGLGAVILFAGNVLTVPAWNAAVMDLAPPEYRGTLIGLSVALSGQALAVGPAIAGVILGFASAPTVFRAAAALAAVTAIAVAAYGRANARAERA